MAVVILDQATYLVKKVHTILIGLLLRYMYVTTKNAGKLFTLKARRNITKINNLPKIGIIQAALQNLNAKYQNTKHRHHNLL